MIPAFTLAAPDRITVCTRPFRATGPRIAAERLGSKLLIHNYGHGGAGWSLSWGSAAAALALIRESAATGPIAVIGAGALGLTSAVAAQRAGHVVTIYARDLPPATRSARATGSWTPDSRIALTASMPAAFPAQWEALARTSWQAFAPYLNAPGTPLEFHPRYTLCGPLTPDAHAQKLHTEDPLAFAWLNPRLADLYTPPTDFAPDEQNCVPFMNSSTVHGWDPWDPPLPPNQHIRRENQLIFNLTEYTRQLLEEFHTRGGRIIEREFHTPVELTALPEPTILHATGYGARALFGDESLTPVRGQITWLPAQSAANYSLFSGDAHQHLHLVSRRDGLVVQWSSHGEATGWQSPGETPDLAESAAGLARFAAFTRP